MKTPPIAASKGIFEFRSEILEPHIFRQLRAIASETSQVVDALIAKPVLLLKEFRLVCLLNNVQLFMNDVIDVGERAQEEDDNSDTCEIGYPFQRFGVLWTLGLLVRGL